MGDFSRKILFHVPPVSRLNIFQNLNKSLSRIAVSFRKSVTTALILVGKKRMVFVFDLHFINHPDKILYF